MMKWLPAVYSGLPCALRGCRSSAHPSRRLRWRTAALWTLETRAYARPDKHPRPPADANPRRCGCPRHAATALTSCQGSSDAAVHHSSSLLAIAERCVGELLRSVAISSKSVIVWSLSEQMLLRSTLGRDVPDRNGGGEGGMCSGFCARTYPQSSARQGAPDFLVISRFQRER
ncbi:hypothetical protein EMIT0P12_140039 [Pseudomonas sp. IT-P12]